MFAPSESCQITVTVSRPGTLIVTPNPSRSRLIALIAIGVIALAGSTLAARMEWRSHASTGRTAWTETAWTLPLDNWGQGRVWRAGSAGITLFARTKTGFCNCFNGIADDDEIDRIGDVDL